MLSLERVIVEEFLAGCTVRELGKKYRKRITYISETLDKMGVARRTQVEAKRLGQNVIINDLAFSEDSPEANYWAGFMMGDGTIRGRTIKLELKSTDRAHIEKFKRFLGSNHKISEFSRRDRRSDNSLYKSTGIQMNSDRLVSDLSRYGLTERKSLTAVIPQSYRFDKDYILGLVESDGSILIRKQRRGKDLPVIKLCGSIDVVTCFVDYAQKLTGFRPTITAEGSIFASRLYSKNAVKVIRELYDGATTFLERKQRTAMQILWLWG